MQQPQRMTAASAGKALSTEQRAARKESLPTTSTTTRASASSRTLTKLWLLGIGGWGHRWVSSLGELPVDDSGRLTAAGALWAAQLGGMPEQSILEAVQHFAGRLEWPPSLAELRKHVLGIPCLDVVADDIGRMKHRFTRLVWRNLDHWKFTRAPERQAERMLRNAYHLAVEQRMGGQELPMHPVALVEQDEPKPHKAAPPEVARPIIDELRRKLDLDPGDVAAEGLPALPLSPVEQVDELRANCISTGLQPDAMALEVCADVWASLRSATATTKGGGTPRFGGFPVRVVKFIPGGKSMRLVRA